MDHHHLHDGMIRIPEPDEEDQPTFDKALQEMGSETLALVSCPACDSSYFHFLLVPGTSDKAISCAQCMSTMRLGNQVDYEELQKELASMEKAIEDSKPDENLVKLTPYEFRVDVRKFIAYTLIIVFLGIMFGYLI